jgi:prepilin-type N-terminal cleavage/methylation domain-containing protein
MRQRPAHSAFTLLELILVMVILAIAAAMVVPTLASFAAGRRTDNAVSNLLAMANYARVHAVSEGRTYRLNLEPSSNSFWLTVQNAGTFQPPANEFGDKVVLTDGIKLDATVVPMPTMQLVFPPDVTPQANTITPPYGQVIAQPNSVMQVPRADASIYMEFLPSGRVDPIHIRITDKQGRVVDMGCQSTTEVLHVLTKAEMS